MSPFEETVHLTQKQKVVHLLVPPITFMQIHELLTIIKSLIRDLIIPCHYYYYKQKLIAKKFHRQLLDCGSYHASSFIKSSCVL